MMSVLSNKKFLALFVAMVTCSASFANAGAVRGSSPDTEQRGRFLKDADKKGDSKKGGSKSSKKSNKSATAPPPTNAPVAVPVVVQNFEVVTTPTVDNSMSVNGFASRCPGETDALEMCVSSQGGQNNQGSVCKICVVGQANLNIATTHGIRSCTDPTINGGLCNDCFDEALDYFNCGTNQNIGDDTTTVTGITTSVTDSSNNQPEYAPIENCPLDAPASGTDCDTQGYTFMVCPFAGLSCSCRKDSTQWLCNPMV